MNKIKITLCMLVLILSFSFPAFSHANDLEAGEKAVFNEFQNAIPTDKIKTVEDLYAKWQEVQNGKSQAVIIDIRTEAEFDSGHIIGSNNIDSGHAYGLPKKINDPNTEIWIFCRTKHRATYFTGMLYKYGYKNAYLVSGGIKEWAEKGYPLGTKYLGEIKVTKYEKQLDEKFWCRENK